MIKLENFISKEAADKLRGNNLHKIAAVMTSKKYGMAIDEINLPVAVTLIGTQAFYKRATHAKILRGLEAVSEILNDEGEGNV